MSTPNPTQKPFFSGLLSLFAADEEVALIPAAITALQGLVASKTALQRISVLATLETNVFAAEVNIAPQLVSQLAPQFNATLQAELAKAQATVAAATTPA